MIEIRHTGTGYAAVVVCDACQEPITDARLALAKRGPDGDAVFAHKGGCDRSLDAMPGWMELVEALSQLQHNTMVDARRGVAR